MFDFKRRALATIIFMGVSLANAATVAITDDGAGYHARGQNQQIDGHSNGVGSFASAIGKRVAGVPGNRKFEVSAVIVDDVPAPGTLGLFFVGAVALAVLRRRVHS